MSSLKKYGWSDFFEASFAPLAEQGFEPARVATQHNYIYKLYGERGEFEAVTAGKMRHEAVSQGELPAVGDWVAVRRRPEGGRATIHHVLPRKSRFTRKAAGQRSEEQIVGANIDTIFLVMAFGNDYNLRRLERYLAAARDSGAGPVVVLSKADLSDDLAARVAEVESLAAGAPVHVTSSKNDEGIDQLHAYLGVGQTVALLGSSGVGKSTLINRLVGRDVQKVNEVREHDERGKHTTTRRELILLPQGGLVLDTPGMRELQLWEAESGVSETFEDVESFARGCYFTDCRHENEPNCAVREAIEAGQLDESRLESYNKLQRELEFIEMRRELNASVVEKRRYKKMMQAVRKREESR